VIGQDALHAQRPSQPRRRGSIPGTAEIRKIEKLVYEHHIALIKAYHEHHNR